MMWKICFSRKQYFRCLNRIGLIDFFKFCTMLVYGVCNMMRKKNWGLPCFYQTCATKSIVSEYILYASVAIERSIGHQNCHNLKEHMLKYMNNSIWTYSNLTAQKLKVLSKL